MNYFILFLIFMYLKKPTTKDFSAQFDESCLTFTPCPKTCSSHGPIKFIREDFNGCLECNTKWRTVMFANNV